MKRWSCWLLTVIATAALLAACGGNGEQAIPAEDAEEAQAQDTPVAAEEAQALETPVATKEAEPTGEDDIASLLEQSFEAQRSAETFRASMSADMKMTGMTMSMKAEYAFRTPAEMYIDMQAGPVSSEMVMTGGRMFMKLPDAGWEEVPSEEVMPFDIESMMGMASVTGPDLELLENLKIDEGEVIDGVETVHISYEIDMEKAMEEASDILGEGFSELFGEGGEMVDFSGKFPVDTWLGKDDKLPRKIEFQMEGQVLGEDYEMDMTMEFFDYGEPVEIPSLEEMLEQVGG